MLYLIPSKSLLKSLLTVSELKEVQSAGELFTALFNGVYSYATSYNADFLITYAELKKASPNDSNHKKEHLEEILKNRIKSLGSYKKKNVDIFILEASREKFPEIRTKLMQLAEETGVKIDCTSLAKSNFSNIKEKASDYWEENGGCASEISDSYSLTDSFFKIKGKYNKAKIPNMNRLTVNGLSKFDDWFKNGYVPYKHIADFARNVLKLPSGKIDEKRFFMLFGYFPSESDKFSDGFYNYLRKLIKKSGFTTHKLSMLCKYYLGESAEKVFCDYKPSYEYIILKKRRNINRQFLIYISLALGLSVKEIKDLFKKGNCVITDFLKEDVLLTYFAENNYLVDVKQRGNFFRYLWESI